MSHVSVAPDSLMLAAADLENISSALDEAHRVAAPPTPALSPAAADEVSVSIAQLFSRHAQDYQVVAREATAFQEQLVQKMTASASSYASAEDVVASLLQALNAKVNYYTDAGNALESILFNYPFKLALNFIIIFPLIPFEPVIIPLFVCLQLAQLFSEVITGQPISYRPLP